jgi:hypothetical protein
MPETPKGGFFAVSKKDGETVAYHNGLAVRNYSRATGQSRSFRPLKDTNPRVFVGPKLKIKWAKRHIEDLQTALKAFHDSNPYQFVGQEDPHTGEYIYRVMVKKCVPIEISAFIGDAVHNLRCVLDYLVCDCIRATGSQPDGGSGLPIDKRPKRIKPGSISKIEGVSPKAERFFLRLKGGKRTNAALWMLHILDIIDKHNAIVTVAAATLQITAKVGVPGTFLSAQGTICFGGGGPGGQPLMMDAGTPDTFKRVFPIEDNVEIYRGPAGFNEELKITMDVAFGEGQVAKGEPVLETLIQLTYFVERVMGICERRCL